jgi:type IV fimbrial biogenesis protein FimT
MVISMSSFQPGPTKLIKSPALRRERIRGFTLIELMMTMAVLGIIVTLAVPSFNNFVLKTRVNGAATEIQMSLLIARSEAVKRNATISVTPVSSTNWTQGWDVTFVDGGGTTRKVKTQAAYTGAMAIAGPAAAVAFGRDGRLTSTAAATFTIDVPGNSNVAAKTVVVDVSGRPNVH